MTPMPKRKRDVLELILQHWSAPWEVGTIESLQTEGLNFDDTTGPFEVYRGDETYLLVRYVEKAVHDWDADQIVVDAFWWDEAEHGGALHQISVSLQRWDY